MRRRRRICTRTGGARFSADLRDFVRAKSRALEDTTRFRWRAGCSRARYYTIRAAPSSRFRITARPRWTSCSPIHCRFASSMLRRGVLMDHESYGLWERHAIEVLTRAGLAPRVALETLALATTRLSGW